jgi:hypothetical protein
MDCYRLPPLLLHYNSPFCNPVQLLEEAMSQLLLPHRESIQGTEIPPQPRVPVGELNFPQSFSTLFHTIRPGSITREGARDENESYNFLQADH